MITINDNVSKCYKKKGGLERGKVKQDRPQVDG